MNIPSPAAVKKIADERKAREAELASSLANAKEKLPPTKAPTTSKRSSKPSTQAKRDSQGSASSPKGKDSRDRSSRSNRSTKSTPTGTTSPEVGLKDRKSTSTTPRKNSLTPSTRNEQSKSKKEFVRPDHLTQRPLRDNEALQKLRTELEKPARGQFKREYRTNARQSGKGLQNKKENS